MLPRAIALDIETAPDPVAFSAYLDSVQRPDFRPQSAEGVCRLLAEHISGVGEKKAPELLEQIGGLSRFWDIVEQRNGAFWPATVRHKLKNAGDLDAMARAIRNGEDAWMADQVKKASFDPRLCRVVTVGLANDEVRTSVSINKTDMDEAELLHQLWRYLAAYFGSHRPVIIAWNGVDFDARVLTLRTLRHRHRGLRMPFSLETKRYAYQPVADPFQYLTGWGRHLGQRGENTLLPWLQYFGIEHPTKEAGMDGSQVADYVDQGRWDEIDAYCLDDAVAEWEIAQPIWDALFPGNRTISIPESIEPPAEQAVDIQTAVADFAAAVHADFAAAVQEGAAAA